MKFNILGKQSNGLIQLNKIKANNSKDAIEKAIKRYKYKHGTCINNTITLW